MENRELDRLSPNEAAILRTIARDGRVLTLIKELAYGDVESLHFPATGVPQDPAPDNEAALSDADVLRGLHSLEQRGMVACSLTVHRVSTTEYICEWVMAEGHTIQTARDALAKGDVAARAVRVTHRPPESNDDTLRAS